MGRPHGLDPAVQPTPQFTIKRDSARNACVSPETSAEQSPPPPTMNGSNASIARSMSRYRRNRTGATDKPPTAVPATPAVPKSTRSQPTEASLAQRYRKEYACEGRDIEDTRTAQSNGVDDDQLAKERQRQHAMDQLTGASQATREMPARPRRQEENQQPTKVKQRDEGKYSEAQLQASHSESATENRKSFLQKVKLSRSKETFTSDDATPKYIEVGGGGIVPGIDAPVSAVNAGERRVLVQYGELTMDFAVTPSTQAQDILMAAPKRLSRDVDPAKFILMESFHQLGLERPLRRYERIRDVMNSWAHDSDSRLFIIPPSSMDALGRLDAQHVPSEQPSAVTVYLYYSQRPRKWDKRYITLRADGQVTMAKKEGSKDQTNVCHLSDFDIYVPSARALAKEIKPLKRICYAIKSQQKSSMFLKTENFVHFFTTNDRPMAEKWYQATQKWRSWYMVNTLGAGQRVEEDAPLPRRSGTWTSSSRKKTLLEDTEPPMTARSSVDQQRTTSKEHFTRKKTQRGHAPPPSSFPLTVDTDVSGSNGGKALVQGISPEEVEASTFSPTGLLGRTYTQRQRAMREREEKDKRAAQDPFSTQGILGGSGPASPAFPSSHYNSRTNTMVQSSEAAGLVSRSQSVHQNGKPLVDLTPVFQEPPQHSRKGRGVTVERGMPLIDAATGPDLAPTSTAIPPATAWRRPPADLQSQTVSSRSRYRSNTTGRERYPSQPYASAYPSSTGASPTSPDGPFIPNSLLASSTRLSNSQGRAGTGKGVATGDRNAARPMLDMSPASPFAEGSLLRQL
ncbi:hypothetical protein N7474_000093 [Penicillium riverlandense]|uniref:uncharacterized protein n=1 Tax=Penicillium riverlandense TaxID=1903569 RepID=UPI0025484F01|nr:uncharacterized protein N7474_000093 [Penicillium riverlandense]KAJ5831782.1 hypothetical protein N7474_000093 [Penicillium riverlandense]